MAGRSRLAGSGRPRLYDGFPDKQASRSFGRRGHHRCHREAAEADLPDVFEDNDEADADEQQRPEADEAQRQRLLSFSTALTKLRKKLKETEEARRAKPGPRRKSNLDKQHARSKLRVNDEL